MVNSKLNALAARDQAHIERIDEIKRIFGDDDEIVVPERTMLNDLSVIVTTLRRDDLSVDDMHDMARCAERIVDEILEYNRI